MMQKENHQDDDALLAQALITIQQLQTKLSLCNSSLANKEPIAVIGVGCHLPGGIYSLDDLWQVLIQERSIITQVPTTRWTTANQTTAYAGLLNNVFGFDNQRFGISPKEAYHLDPQHRQLLMRTEEALHSAHINPKTLYQSETGVFIGIGNSDYYERILFSGEDNIDAYVASGNASSIAAGRISHHYGFKGPCVALDTACSSSLYTIHHAAHSLRMQECQLAVVGAVNLILTPTLHNVFAKMGMLAADGKCKVFSAQADGYVRGEGCVVLILTLLSTAQAKNYPVLGLIEGSAVVHDGRTSGLTVPHGPSQTAVIMAAMQQAAVTTEEIDYLETHGTGTTLGDPIEIKALNRVFKSRSKALLVGSIKANLGHLEIAAGMASLLKVLLMLHYRKIPAQLYCAELTSHVDWSNSCVQIPLQPINWPHQNAKAIVGISGFGFSGANVHVIVSSPPTSLTSLPKVDLNFKLIHFEVPHRQNTRMIEPITLTPKIYKETWCLQLSHSIRINNWLPTLPTKITLDSLVLKRYSAYCELLTYLEKICVQYIIKIVQNYYHIDTVDALGNLQQNFHVPSTLNPQYAELLKYCITLLLTEEITPDFSNQSTLTCQEVHALFPEFGVEINFLQSSLSHLSRVLTGELTATQLLFAGGDKSLAAQFYGSTILGEYFNLQIAAIVKDYCHNFSHQQKYIRILEIGAGSGSTTHYILPLLIDVAVEYHFTDLSAYFLNQAKQRFSEFSFVHYKILDISDDLSGDIASMGQFDVVIAANVIHATPLLTKSMLNVARLLCKNGILILRECTKPTLTADLTFGLSDGWWDFRADPERQGYPLLDTSKWCQLLAKLDFVGVQSLTAIENSYEHIFVAKRAISHVANELTIIFAATPIDFNSINLHKHCLVTLGTHYHHHATNHFEISATNQNDYSTLFNTIDLPKYKQVNLLFYYGLSNTTIETLKETWQEYFLSPIYCLQTLNNLKPLPNNLTLYFCKPSSIDTHSLAMMLAGSMRGLARVIAVEYPLWYGGFIESDENDLSALITLINNEANDDDKEAELTYMQNNRLVRRLENIKHEYLSAELRIDPTASYLITGASGGIGIKTMEWLATLGVRHLVLVSRYIDNQYNTLFTSCCAQLQLQGLQLTLFTMDISHQTDIENLFLQFGKTLPPLKGVFHSAGVGGDSLIHEITSQTLPAMIDTKVLGSYYLHYYSQVHELDYFVIYGSVMATWGAKGKAHYAAVNAFGTELVKHRKSRNLPACIVDWGPWKDIGMINAASTEAAHRVGLIAVEANQYFPLLKQVLCEEESHVIIAAVDWPKLTRIYGSYQNFHLADNLYIDKTIFMDVNSIKSANITKDAVHQRTNDRVATILSSVLEYDSNGAINYDRGFYDQGLDSLMALTFVDKLSTSLNVMIKSVDLFKYPNVTTLAQYIDVQLGNTLPTGNNSVNESEQSLQELLTEIDMSIQSPNEPI